MHFKGRSAVECLGPTRLSCSGLLRRQTEDWAFAEVTPSRGAASEVQGVHHQGEARCGLWVGQNLTGFSWYEFYCTFNIRYKERFLPTTSNLIYLQPTSCQANGNINLSHN